MGLGAVANLLATSRCNGIWETTRHNRLLPVPTCYGTVADLSFMLPTCYGEVANLLRTYYGKTGVMDFGLYQRCTYYTGEIYGHTGMVRNAI